MKSKAWIREEILRELLARESVTRPALREKLKCRPATLFEVIDALKDEGIICEPDRKGKRTGRRASPIRFSNKAASFIGLELQPDYVIGTVIDLTGRELLVLKEDLEGGRNRANAEAAIKAVLASFQRQDPGSWSLIRGVGFADPGLVDPKTRRSIVAVNIEGWRYIDTANLLAELTGIKNSEVYSATMARTYMEYQRLQPGGPASLFHLEIGQGIGGGFIQNGELYRGAMNCGMEIGHLIVEPDGALCQCGNRGCLEAVAGENGIRNRVEDLLAHQVQTQLSDASFSLGHFITCVKSQDKVAKTLATEVSEQIAKGLQCIVAILNPAMITLSGELTGLDKLLLSKIRDHLEMSCMPAAVNGLQIRISELGEKGTALGVASLARDKFLFGLDKVCHGNML